MISVCKFQVTKSFSEMSSVDSTVLQDVCKRVDKAFERFLIGDYSGKRSGKPRFKTEASFRTITFATANNEWIKLIRKNWLYIRLPKLGMFKVRMHRPIPDGFTASLLFVQNTSPFVQNTSPFVQNTSLFVQNISLFVQNISPFVQNISPFVQNTSLFVQNTSLFVQNTSLFVQNTSLFVQNTSLLSCNY